ncbi:MAG: YebC/PmpR family DNA-binding transcriptional regulator [Neisseriales bacterium]|nr:MAG: YebC/PmpR family DNA-binding transcriptional regulator [Neisseriales bacterium]
MSGHSKWANIKHKKERADAKRGQIFTRLIREITVAAKIGGSDVDTNARLRLAVDKAYSANMPKDTIKRAIDRGTGNLEDINYVALRYEGYGAGGAAVMVDCLTDNKTRTAANVRHVFSKFGGNMGTNGCVAFQFIEQGYLLFAPQTDENALLETALNAGAKDLLTHEDGSFEVLIEPDLFISVRTALENNGLQAADGEVTLCPLNKTPLTEIESRQIQKLIDALEELEDVQEVYTTAMLTN